MADDEGDEPDMSIGKRIEEARIHKGISQSQLSRETGLKQGTISRYEHDVCVPSIEIIRILADALDVRYYDLILDEEDRKQIREEWK